jgi:hypothetical protein
VFGFPRFKRARQWTRDRNAAGCGLVNRPLTCGNTMNLQVNGMIDDREKFSEITRSNDPWLDVVTKSG